MTRRYVKTLPRWGVACWAPTEQPKNRSKDRPLQKQEKAPASEGGRYKTSLCASRQDCMASCMTRMQGHRFRFCQFTAILVFGRNLDDLAIDAGEFHADFAVAGGNGFPFAGQARRWVVWLRTPRVVVSAKKSAWNLASSAGLQRTVSSVPGRFFFICMGGGEDVQRAGGQGALDEIAVDLGIEVIEVGFDDADFLGRSSLPVSPQHRRPSGEGRWAGLRGRLCRRRSRSP